MKLNDFDFDDDDESLHLHSTLARLELHWIHSRPLLHDSFSQKLFESPVILLFPGMGSAGVVRPPTSSSSAAQGGVIFLLILVLALVLPFLLFFLPDSNGTKEKSATEVSTKNIRDQPEQASSSSATTAETTTTTGRENEKDANDESLISEQADTNSNESSTNQWRCACEGGFLPPGMLQSLGGAEAVFRMSTGQCYHKR